MTDLVRKHGVSEQSICRWSNDIENASERVTKEFGGKLPVGAPPKNDRKRRTSDT